MGPGESLCNKEQVAPVLKAHLWSGPMLCGLAGPLKTLHKEARSVINLSQASFKALREPASRRSEPRASKGKGHMAIQRWVWLGDRLEGTNQLLG